MMGKDYILSRVRLFLKESLAGRPSLKVQADVRADTGKRSPESTIVHFRQLLQKARREASTLDITGKDEHTALISAEAGRGGTFSILSLFMPRYEGGHGFRELRTDHFRQLGGRLCSVHGLCAAQ
jgi:hypothetical protein